jgi:WNK lysine deficient protein kinase
MWCLQLDHPNIISFYTSWFNRGQKQIVFITELMNTGSLTEFVQPIPVLRWRIVKRWARQILAGLAHLHQQKIIHRNVNCDDIFIAANKGLLKIGDLGLSTVCQKAASCIGTAPFMAPELFEEDYDEKVDIYAFGMTILQMITKEVRACLLCRMAPPAWLEGSGPPLSSHSSDTPSPPRSTHQHRRRTRSASR